MVDEFTLSQNLEARKILIASSLATRAGFYHDLCLMITMLGSFCLLKRLGIVSCAEVSSIWRGWEFRNLNTFSFVSLKWMIIFDHYDQFDHFNHIGQEAESSARGTIEIGVDRVTHLVVSDDATEPVREDYPDLVCADGSLEVMQRGLDMVIQELYDHMVEIQSAAMSEMISTLEGDNMRLRGRSDRDYYVFEYTTMLTATHFGMAQAAINKLIAKCVAEALEAYGASRNPVTKTKMENEQQDDNVEENVNNGNSNGLVKLTTEVYCLRNEIILMETELWNLTVKEKYIGGLLANIQGNVIAAELTRLHDAIRIANNLMDQKFKGYAEKKRRMWQELIRSGTMLKGKRMLEPCITTTSAVCTTKGRVRNKKGNNEAKERSYAIGGGGSSPDSNVVTAFDSSREMLSLRLRKEQEKEYQLINNLLGEINRYML
nr:hypothetical protein [Tanacetum cinerariifolium]